MFAYHLSHQQVEILLVLSVRKWQNKALLLLASYHLWYDYDPIYGTNFAHKMSTLTALIGRLR